MLSALTQILHGLILNAWHNVCGFSSLEEFTKSKPTPTNILELACTIVTKYATPTEKLKTVHKSQTLTSITGTNESDSDVDLEAPSEPLSSSSKSDHKDIIHENILRLTHDLLYVTELVKAVKDGDIGHVEDILPDLACMFRGAGSNNYSTEILHFLFNLKEVWTPEFAYVDFIHISHIS